MALNWKARAKGLREELAYANEVADCLGKTAGNIARIKNAEIANLRTAVAERDAEIERIRNTVAELRIDQGKALDERDGLLAHIEQMAAERKSLLRERARAERLAAVLEFYGDKGNYTGWDLGALPKDKIKSAVEQDGGDRARQALAEGRDG